MITSIWVDALQWHLEFKLFQSLKIPKSNERKKFFKWMDLFVFSSMRKNSNEDLSSSDGMFWTFLCGFFNVFKLKFEIVSLSLKFSVESSNTSQIHVLGSNEWIFVLWPNDNFPKEMNSPSFTERIHCNIQTECTWQEVPTWFSCNTYFIAFSLFSVNAISFEMAFSEFHLL